MGRGERCPAGAWPRINPDRSKLDRARWREFFIRKTDLSGTRIRYRRSEPPPPISYAITLEILEGGRWQTVRLWDNADALDEHHEHAYTRADGKQPPRILVFSTENEAMAAAVVEAKRRARDIVRQWRAS